MFCRFCNRLRRKIDAAKYHDLLLQVFIGMCKPPLHCSTSQEGTSGDDVILLSGRKVETQHASLMVHQTYN